LNATRQEYQTSLKVTADKIDEIVRHANDCTEDFNQCKTFVSDVVFLPLPKIGGDLMTLKQLEESLAALQVEINSLKTQTDNAQNTANDAVNRANNAQNTANDGVNKAINAQNTANSALDLANTVNGRTQKISFDGNSTLIDAGGKFLAIQSDGNVVVYRDNGQPLFATETDN
jgi:uncharacterized small protein (DUF1192 family)